MIVKRRTVLRALSAGVGTGLGARLGLSGLATPALAANKPLKIGLLTVLTGPLAADGIQIRQGTDLFFKERNYTLAGRKVELIIQDSGGSPVGAKTKAQELIERDRIDVLLGPLAAFELLALNDYLIQHQMPTLAFAGADNLTSRNPNPYLIRVTMTSSQAMYPLADYAAQTMKLRTVDTIADDFAFGYEEIGGFQQVFDDDGGKIRKKLWSPLATPDYTPYIAQISGVDGVVVGLTGSNPGKFMQQYASLGLKGKYPVLGGPLVADDALLKSFTDDSVGLISTSPYSATYQSSSNEKFVAAMVKRSGDIPGVDAATAYLNGVVVEAGLEKTDGKADDKAALVAAMRSVSFKDSIRGPFHFDKFGNVVGNIFIRRLDKRDEKLTNTIVKIYPNVSQFWTFNVAKWIAMPDYTRDGTPPLLKQHPQAM